MAICLERGCPRIVPKGRCAEHARTHERQRGTASERGYTSRWVAFRARYMDMLLALNIPPACGAVLPGGPVTNDSQCKQEGRLTLHGLQLDHEPPLTDLERKTPAVVMDPKRIQVLCGARCHPAKTRRQHPGRRFL
jgi:hypothetical protein